MPRKKNQKPKFSGKLNTPISIKNLPGLPKLGRKPIIMEGEEAEQQYQSALQHYNGLSSIAAAAIAIEKFPLLFQHYGIPEYSTDRWEILSLKLAIDFVPGFSLASAKPPGAPTKWHLGTLAALYLDVLDNQENQITLEKMFFELSKKEPWKSLCKPDKNSSNPGGKTLQNIYNKAMSGGLGKVIAWLDNLPTTNDSKRKLLEIMAGKNPK